MACRFSEADDKLQTVDKNLLKLQNVFDGGTDFRYSLPSMKMINAIIRPHRLQDVKEALADIGVVGLTVTDVRGAGRQRGQVERYRGSEYSIDLLAKIKLEVAVLDDQVEEVVQAIRTAAYTGEIGDGKIFILPLEDSIRVRTGERGEDSL
jgi:nitrogen regulatory protein PII